MGGVLGGVHEDRLDPQVAHRPGRTHQRDVALVQVAHLGDEPDGAACGPSGLERAAQLVDGLDQPHDGTPGPSASRSSTRRWARSATSAYAGRSDSGMATRWRATVWRYQIGRAQV